MPIKVGDFFEMIVVKSAIDNVYPGGANAFVAKLKIGEITDEFVIWGTMGQSDILNIVENELKEHGLNCDDNDEDCVYIKTSLRGIPKKTRCWLIAEKDEDGVSWLYLKK
jgi:hypothetical protein